MLEMSTNEMMSKVEKLWRESDNYYMALDRPIQRCDTTVKIGEYIHSVIEYNGMRYTLFMAWRDPSHDNNYSGPHFHVGQDDDLWKVIETDSRGISIHVVDVPYAVADAFLASIARNLIVRTPYNTYSKKEA